MEIIVCRSDSNPQITLTQGHCDIWVKPIQFPLSTKIEIQIQQSVHNLPPKNMLSYDNEYAMFLCD